MKIQKVVCPICRNADIEWEGDPRFLDHWFCHACGHYFGTPMMVEVNAPSHHTGQLAHHF